MKKTGAIISLLILIVVIVNFVRTMKRINEAEGEIEEVRQEVNRLELERQRLLALDQEAETAEFVERELREKLGLGREGEVVVVLPNDEGIKQQATSIKEEGENLANWQKWARAFGFD